MAPLGVLVTGGAGFIGSRLVARLVADGHRVTVLDNLHEQVHGVDGKSHVPNPDVEWVRGDVRDEDAVARATRGVDVVHHLAAETGVGQSQYEIGRYVATNTHGTAVVLQAAVEAGASHVVLASSRAVYGEGQCHCPRCVAEYRGLRRTPEQMTEGEFELRCPRCGGRAAPVPTAEDTDYSPTSVYGLTKVQVEQLAAQAAHTYGLPLTVLRPFNVYGPGQSLRNPYVGVLATFLRRLRTGLPLELYEDGRMLRDFVFVDDVVEVLARCTAADAAYGKTWNVGTGRGVELGELAQVLAGITGLDADVHVSGRYRVGDVRHAIADTARLEAELGFVPSTPLRDGLSAFAAWAADAVYDDNQERIAVEELTARNVLRQAAAPVR